MRLRKTVKIDEREVTVYELRVRDVRRLFERTGQLAEDADVLTMLEEELGIACDLPAKDFDDLAPSEVKVLFDAFREVNAVFFEALEAVGLLGHLKKAISLDLSAAFAASSSGAIPAPGITDGASS